MKDKLTAKILSKDYLIKQLKEEVGILKEEIKRFTEKQNMIITEEKKICNVGTYTYHTITEEKKDKVFCGECCYFIRKSYDSILGYMEEGCKSPLNIPIQEDTHIKKETIYKKPSELNKNNDCSLYRKYEGKLYYGLYYGREE